MEAIVEEGLDKFPRLFGIFPYERIGRSGDTEYLFKLHLTPWDWWPFEKRMLLHVFGRPDEDDHPHDHPFGFRSFILWGGYTERVWHSCRNGGWIETLERRWPGTTHKVPATHTHLLEKLHAKKVVTLVIRGTKEQDWGFWVGPRGGSRAKVPWWQYLGLPEKPPAAYGED
jgi:hypothetical protein